VSRLTRLGTGLAVAGAVHAAWNSRRLRVPPADPPPVAEPVALLLPVRDEAHRVEPCLRALLAQTGVRDLRILVLDDGSTDGTADVVRRVAGADPRVRLVEGQPLPAGWWGKPWACAQLAGEAAADDPAVLVFVDADVVLARHAVAASVALLRWAALDLVSPYPRQLAVTPAERLVQPLLQWSWLTTLPLRVAERSARPSLAAANGQLLVVDAEAYRRAGGHQAVRAEMLEDVALLRAVKAPAGAAAWSTAPRWRPAGCTPGGRTCATATPSRCGPPSAPPAGATAVVAGPGGRVRAATAGGAARVPGGPGGLRGRGGRTGGRCPAYRDHGSGPTRSRTRRRWPSSARWWPPRCAGTGPARSRPAAAPSERLGNVRCPPTAPGGTRGRPTHRDRHRLPGPRAGRRLLGRGARLRGDGQVRRAGGLVRPADRTGRAPGRPCW
jgi:hypothetical protein